MRGVTHPRVVNVKAKGAEWDVYVGRGPCPARGSHGPWGNPFPVGAHGREAMTLYLRFLSGERFGMVGPVAHAPGAERGPDLVERARRELRGKVLGCWCKGRYPVCHAEVLARLADGEALDAIRADMLARIAPPDVAGKPQRELFAGENAPGVST